MGIAEYDKALTELIEILSKVRAAGYRPVQAALKNGEEAHFEFTRYSKSQMSEGGGTMLDKNQVLAALRNADQLPTIGKKQKKAHRSIYEVASPRGHFHITYATFPGGTSDEVPLLVIAELERDGLIKSEFPEVPDALSWKLVTEVKP